jgi:Leucine-rich repeat (LRR) protein
VSGEVGRLTNLTHLDLNHNALVGLPFTFGDLCALQYLNVGNNLLDKFPEVILSLTNLVHLDVRETCSSF